MSRSVRWVHSKECYFLSTYNFLAYNFISTKFLQKFFQQIFFWWSIEFPQQNISQSETRTGDKKLSVELYIVTLFVAHGNIPQRCSIQFSYVGVYCIFVKFNNEIWIARYNHLEEFSRIFRVSVSRNISSTFPCTSFSVKSFI